MLRRLQTLFVELPRLMRIGLLIVFAGGMLDLVYHALPAQSAAIVDIYLGQGAWSIHLLALAGMAITMVGIFAGKGVLKASRLRHTRPERRHTIER